MKKLDKKLLEENIEKIAKLDLDENNIFGSAYAVCQNGELVYKKYFGTTKLHGAQAVSDETMFRMASMTKPITAVAMLILVDRGLVSIDDPVKKYIPEFAEIHIIDDDGNDLGKPEKDVTILHLLSHSSGFGSRNKNYITIKDSITIDGTIKYYIKEGLEFEPMSREHYSGFASFDVLTVIAEQVSGVKFDKFLKDEIFTPCEMYDTTFAPTPEQWNRIIELHNKVDGKCVVGETTDGCVFLNLPSDRIISGAGLASTLPDYVKFAEMLANDGKVGEKRILSEKAMKLLSKPYLSKEALPGYQNWGLGVRVVEEDTYPWKLPVGSYGWAGYYGAHFWIDPINKISAVYLKNSLYDNRAQNDSSSRFEVAVMDSLK